MSSSFTLLKKTFNIFSENPKRYLLILSVPLILNFLIASFEPNYDARNPNISATLIYLVFILISFTVSAFLTIALVHAVADVSLSIENVYTKAKNHFFKYILLMLGMTGLLFIAFILLIIPGIWLSVAFSFAVYFMLLKGSGVKLALSESMALVKGKWWTVATKMCVLSIVVILFYLVVQFIASFLGGISENESVVYAISSTLGLLAAPFSIAYMYLLFLELQANTQLQNPEVTSASPEVTA